MFQRLIDDFKDSTGTALRLTSLAAAAAVALLVTTAFLCAAAFVFVLEKYGPVQACLTGAAIFFVVTLIAAGCYMVRKRQIEARAEQAAKTAKSTAQTVLADPMLVAAGIQVVRAIGVKKLIPILAVGGLALGFWRAAPAQAPAKRRRSSRASYLGNSGPSMRYCHPRAGGDPVLRGASSSIDEASAYWITRLSRVMTACGDTWDYGSRASIRSRSGRAEAVWRPRSTR